MDTKNRWRDFGVVALIAVGLGAADAWSHRTPASCPACEFETLRAASESKSRNQEWHERHKESAIEGSIPRGGTETWADTTAHSSDDS